MVYIHPDITKAAIVCTLEVDSTTGTSRVLHPDGHAIGKDAVIYATTAAEHAILKHQGYNVRLNEHPSKATLEGVEGAETVKNVGCPDVAPTVE